MTTRTQRLDDLPFTGRHRRLLTGSGVGWALDAMDVGLISFVMAALAVQWDLSSTQLSWIGSIGFVGMAIGASLGGLLADRIGRRQVFAATLLVYGLATGAAALSTPLTRAFSIAQATDSSEISTPHTEPASAASARPIVPVPQ